MKTKVNKESAAKKIDAVFEGGGVKGSAFAGAIAVAENLGYKFVNLAGTSAGSIVAALLASGYGAAEIRGIIDSLDYARFKDETMLDMVPIVGKGLSLLLTDGLYKGDWAERWISELLAKKGIVTFGDLVIPEFADKPKYRYKLQVVASDITRGKHLILPWDARDYGMEPDRLNVARAIRMSISIPFFFEPILIGGKSGEKCRIVDGGILSNYPVWLLDDGTADPPWPTIGFKLVDPDENRPHQIGGPVSFFKAMFETMMEAHDARYISDHDFMRTVAIKTMGVQTTDFDLPLQKKNMLYKSGEEAATQFFRTWDFEKYKKMWRNPASYHRTDYLWRKWGKN
jgi:NTE family protein